MKLLTCNAGYLLGYENVLGGYVPPPVTSLVGNAAVEQAALEQLVQVIEREQPDVVALQEVDQGSHRTRTDGQLQAIQERLTARGLSYGGEAVTKYGDEPVVAGLPFYRDLGNAVLTRSARPTRQHFLSTGRKRLVLETELAGARLFTVHLSLRAGTRAAQLEELAEIVTDSDDGRPVIVAGDFNAFGGPVELADFTEATGLECRSPGPTVPERPFDELFVDSRQLDLVCCSPSLTVDRCSVLDEQISDHRPIVLEAA